MKPQMTYELAMSAAMDAANARMRTEGRTQWNVEDYNHMCATVDRLYPLLRIIREEERRPA